MCRFSVLIAIFLYSCILSVSQASAQSREKDSISFSDALKRHLPNYNREVKYAFQHKDYQKAKSLFDSLTNCQLKGAYFDDFEFFNLKGKHTSLYAIQQPIFLITYASWCVPGKGGIAAINKMADTYTENVQFIVLFWDTKQITKKQAKAFTKAVKVLYVDETSNQAAFTVHQLKHSLGIKTCFLLNKEKAIEKILRYPAANFSIPVTKALENNIALIENSIKPYLLKELLLQQEVAELN